MNAKNLLKIAFVGLIASTVLVGCGTVERQSTTAQKQAASIPKPPAGYAGVFIYRSDSIMSNVSKALLTFDFSNKSLYIDGQYFGDSDSKVFYYRLVKPGQHTIQTESMVSENDIKFNAIEGYNYFFEQTNNSATTSLTRKSEREAREVISQLTLAKNIPANKEKDLKTADYSEGKGSIPGTME